MIWTCYESHVYENNENNMKTIFCSHSNQTHPNMPLENSLFCFYYWISLLLVLTIIFLIFIWQSLLFDLQFLACTFGSARHLALQMLAFSLDWHPNSVALQCTFRGKQVFVRACLHWGGEPQVGEVTRLGGVTRLPFWSPHLSCKQDQIKVRDYVDRRVTPPKRVTSPTRGPPPPCKQAVGLFAL